ncbi:HEAT repeat domain-containing protein [Methyloglobulus sp.]|uniref:HEAT repeat domain-containing protein n=1 Tax=Methyloglobulus sp. TaxID=2518622 RepID=UPI0032B85762
MYLDLSQQLRNILLPSVIVLLIGFTAAAVAKTPGKATKKAQTDLVISDNKGSELQLEVRQMPLAEVLENITNKTHVPIHYSVLPEGLVTATCVGTTLKKVLECLLDRRADLIVRYPRTDAKAESKGQVAEAWILGSRLDNQPSSATCIATAGDAANKGSLSLRQSQQDAEPDQTDDLLKMAQSKNPTERADAMSALLAGGREGDPAVKAALEQALTDQDANVRAQAISSLSHREGSAASAAIQEALHDSSVDVRMMAVDGITDDVGLLQQAINDSDETVRSLAAVKLEQLTQENGGAK